MVGSFMMDTGWDWLGIAGSIPFCLGRRGPMFAGSFVGLVGCVLSARQPSVRARARAGNTKCPWEFVGVLFWRGRLRPTREHRYRY